MLCGLQDLAPGRRVYLSYESARKHNVDSNDKTYVKKVAAAKDNKNKTMVYLELPDEKEVAVEPVEIQAGAGRTGGRSLYASFHSWASL